jgi:hypothetical protein
LFAASNVQKPTVRIIDAELIFRVVVLLVVYVPAIFLSRFLSTFGFQNKRRFFIRNKMSSTFEQAKEQAAQLANEMRDGAEKVRQSTLLFVSYLISSF